MHLRSEHLTDEVVAQLSGYSRHELLASRRGGEYHLEKGPRRIAIGAAALRLSAEGLEAVVTTPGELARAHRALETRLGEAPFPDTPRDRDAARAIPGVVGAEDLPGPELERRIRALLEEQPAQGEAHGQTCVLSEHIAAPYEEVFAYLMDVPALAEWTLNLRALHHVGGGLYRGKMVFSPQDAGEPTTDIYIRAEAWRGAEHGLLCYPCAWDQGHELWMRYYFLLADARHALGAPGTVLTWVNWRHRFYDRAAEPVPDHVAAGRARTDRPWAGDAWPLFQPLHRLELTNLKRILEHRAPLPRPL